MREGDERSDNPYSAGPMFVLSEQEMDYHLLAGIYAAIRSAAARRGLSVRLLEYLEPGPEFCRSEWKTERHPEVAAATADAGGHIVPGVIDVTLPLAADAHKYAACPGGIPDGLVAGDFVAAQTGAFVSDFGLDGVLLGNQFGLVGFWRPSNAPPVTPERIEGITRFFTRLRAEIGVGLIYWMHTYWPVETEHAAWGMTDEAYANLDAVLVSTFAVIVERTKIVPNLRSKAALRGPRVIFGLDFRRSLVLVPDAPRRSADLPLSA
ncbi:hypothetical protein ACGFJ7_33945 [Actinoplanes sp. NPDC048988]|uniref:hypothetical protein n=1 Tax=Actinoplanes sp. NPDC048988 TaxID=3363901 RepID=UPI003710FA27